MSEYNYSWHRFEIPKAEQEIQSMIRNFVHYHTEVRRSKSVFGIVGIVAKEITDPLLKKYLEFVMDELALEQIISTLNLEFLIIVQMHEKKMFSGDILLNSQDLFYMQRYFKAVELLIVSLIEMKAPRMLNEELIVLYPEYERYSVFE
jgi:flagellar motor component MotA